MRTAPFLTIVLMICLCAACSHANAGPTAAAADAFPGNGEAAIVHAWHGEYPVAQLDRLPDGQRTAAVGAISDAAVFKNVWQAFKPGAPLPGVDFALQLVLFARNTWFFNRITIGKVILVDGVADLLTMETKSAMPIEDRVAMSMVLVPREGIRAIRTGAGITSIP